MSTCVHIKEILVLCGLPCAGKTTWVQNYICNHDGVVLIERDVVIAEMYRDTELLLRVEEQVKTIVTPISKLYSSRDANARNDIFTQEYVTRVSRLIHECSAQVCIVDGLHAQRISREFIRFFENIKRRAVYISTPASVCAARFNNESSIAKKRRTQLSSRMIFRLAEIFEPPTIDEGFDSVISCDSV